MKIYLYIPSFLLAVISCFGLPAHRDTRTGSTVLCGAGKPLLHHSNPCWRHSSSRAKRQNDVVPITIDLVHVFQEAPSSTVAPNGPISTSRTPSFSLGLPHASPASSACSQNTITSGLPSHTEPDNADVSLHRRKVAVIAGILSVIVGLLLCLVIVKLSKDAVCRYLVSDASRQGKGKQVGKAGVSTCDPVPWVNVAGHNVVLTRPDGSEISQTFSANSDGDGVGVFAQSPLFCPNPPPTHVPPFPPPIAPEPFISSVYSSLLTPTDNLVRHNLAGSRNSDVTVLSSSTSCSNLTVPYFWAASEGSVKISHRRVHSAPVSINASLAEMVGACTDEEGYWDSLDTYMRPHSTARQDLTEYGESRW